MANELDQPLAVPSVLGVDGASFSVTRTDAASSSIGIGNPFGARMFITNVPFPSMNMSTGTPNVVVSYGRHRAYRSYSYSSTAGNNETVRVVILGGPIGF